MAALRAQLEHHLLFCRSGGQAGYEKVQAPPFLARCHTATPGSSYSLAPGQTPGPSGMYQTLWSKSRPWKEHTGKCLSSEPNSSTKGRFDPGSALHSYETQSLLIYQSWDLNTFGTHSSDMALDYLKLWGVATKQQRAGFQGGD